MLSDGVPMGGEEALRIGLADVLVDDAQVMDTAVQMAQALAALPAEAFGRMKQRLNHPSASLDEGLAREETDQAVCLLGEDFAEGFDAFTNWRTADFIGRPGARKS